MYLYKTYEYLHRSPGWLASGSLPNRLYIHVYIYIYIHIYIGGLTRCMCIYVYVYISIEGKIAIDRYIHIYREIRTSISIAPPGGSPAVACPTDYIYIYIYIYKYMYMYVYVYISIWIKIAIHRYIDIYIIRTSISIAPPGGSQAEACPTDRRIQWETYPPAYSSRCARLRRARRCHPCRRRSPSRPCAWANLVPT